jgi:phosphate transport system permease protein
MSGDTTTMSFSAQPTAIARAAVVERARWNPRLARRHLAGKVFFGLTLLSVVFALACLVVLLATIWQDGSGKLSLEFLQSFPSRFAARAGIKSALYGSVYIAAFTFLFAVPVGVGAAVYLEEFATDTRLRKFVDINIANLAGVPSIVYGMLGLAVFVRICNFGRSILAGALTMAVLILPIIIVASREALKAVPRSIRLAAYGLGATQWQTIRAHVLPAAMPGIMTGVILSMARAAGETAPLLMIGALSYVAFTPEGPMDGFTVLPIQIFNWVSRPQDEFHQIAAAGIVVLLAVLLATNAVAIAIRYRFQKDS